MVTTGRVVKTWRLNVRPPQCNVLREKSFNRIKQGSGYPCISYRMVGVLWAYILSRDPYGSHQTGVISQHLEEISKFRRVLDPSYSTMLDVLTNRKVSLRLRIYVPNWSYRYFRFTDGTVFCCHQ
jgi:hypothetical protein